MTARIELDETELEFSAVRASGPGGQNINKVSSAVVLRFDLNTCSLDEALRERLRKLPDRRISKSGVITIKAMRYRNQVRNREDAIERLRSLIDKAAKTKPKRIPTRPGKAAKRRRLEAKKRRSDIKATRAKPKLQ